MSLLHLALALLAALVLILAIALLLALRKPGAASRGRNQRAQVGEAEAEALLEAEGYTILERQAVEEGCLFIDGEPVDYTVRADLYVERDGQAYVAEVKTGERAPDPRHPPTRRQLREYRDLFGVPVLLVDVEAGRILTIDFD
jgi:hypothetical protein